MAPSQTRKRKSDDMATPEATTPVGSPVHKKMKITEVQKQALIDNLQLEITERARRLRAQYALQCKDLRARIDRRINRIPLSMRKMTMTELMAKHERSTQPAPNQAKTATQNQNVRSLPSVHQRSAAGPLSPVRATKSTAVSRNKKRKSSEIHIASDKENEGEMDATVPDNLPVQKNTKRAKAGMVARAGKNTGGVLSPRSHNSRTLPRSPVKGNPQSPTKSSHIAQPLSPVKSHSPLKSAASAATSAITAFGQGMLESARQRGAALAPKSSRSNARTTSKDTITSSNMPPPATKKRAAAAPATRTASQMSNHSVTTDVSTISNSTDSTVITKPKRAGRTAATKPTKTNASTTAAVRGNKIANKSNTSSTVSTAKTGALAKVTALKKSGITNKKMTDASSCDSEPAAGRRTLRKRT